MENLKIKIKDTEASVPIGLIVGMAVVIVGLCLMVFEGISFMEIRDWLLAVWKEIKR